MKRMFVDTHTHSNTHTHTHTHTLAVIKANCSILHMLLLLSLLHVYALRQTTHLHGDMWLVFVGSLQTWTSVPLRRAVGRRWATLASTPPEASGVSVSLVSAHNPQSVLVSRFMAHPDALAKNDPKALFGLIIALLLFVSILATNTQKKPVYFIVLLFVVASFSIWEFKLYFFIYYFWFVRLKK